MDQGLGSYVTVVHTFYTIVGQNLYRTVIKPCRVIHIFLVSMQLEDNLGALDVIPKLTPELVAKMNKLVGK